jgi:cytochrome c553
VFTRVLALALLATVAGSALAADSAAQAPAAAPSTDPHALQAGFDNTVKPYAAKYCGGCHGGATPSAQFDIKSYQSMSQVAADFPRWALVGERLHAKEMPPKPMKAPPQAETDAVLAWIEAVRASEIKRLAGDPGIVLARRLSNAEYNYTIRDLTRQDMQLTRQFPVDPANPAGFDNSGESLVMSPALLNKYLQTSRQIADHMVLTPDGIDFAAHLVQVDSDRDRYAIGRILAFYKAQPTDFADYFEAAWRYRHRAALGAPKATLASIAADMKISAKYLPMVWGILNEKGAVGPVAKLQGMWLALPAPGASQPGAVEAGAADMRDFVVKIRSHTSMQFDAPKVVGLPGQSQPLHNWRLKEYAANHRKSDPAALRHAGDPAPVLAPIPRFPRLHADATPRWRIVLAHARSDDLDLVVPEMQRAQYEKAFDRFAEVFPDTFVVSERGRFWPDNSEDKGRFLSAGYHNSGGYYRDDAALMELILDKEGQQELDRLWAEFDAIANHTERTWTQWYFNNSGAVDSRGELFDAESGSPRPVGHEVTDTVVINQMRDKYLAKAMADPTNDKAAVDAIRHHFQSVDTVLRNLEKERTAAEPKHLAALTEFAERAYRRPLTGAERADIKAYYQQLRTQNRLSHSDAIRDSLVAVLMSPDFLYRLDLSQTAAAPSRVVKAATGGGERPYVSEQLSPYSLASRLSYFLWSSMPDAELMKHAASGDITDPKVLLAQTRRMLKDPRMSGLATEFTGNWLGFRQFETNNSVDRERFPAFDDALREAMFQEPIRFMADAIARDASVLDLLYADHTFVNPPLAKHYGMPEVAGDVNTWIRVDKADRYGRGGILPMAVFMTQNSPGLRTSPVKRGNWVVQKVLGVRVPPPPPEVPELPSDEAKTDLPIREMLAQHRSVPMCASCHDRFDSFGLVFEGYGPVGGARTHDLAGRPVDTSATFPGGFEGKGMEGLHAYIRENRQDKYVENISRKLLAYALNRSLQMSDEGLVDELRQRLVAGDHRFSALIEAIVISPQFRNRRAPEAPVGQQTQMKPVSPALTRSQVRGGD